MLNNGMKNELTLLVAHALAGVDPAIAGLPHDEAMLTVASIVTEVFADYVDFSDDEADSITETLAILNDEEAMTAIAEAQTELDEMSTTDILTAASEASEAEVFDRSLFGRASGAPVIWFDTAEEAFAAND